MSLSWRVQNIVVIGRVYSKLERSEFSSNFEWDRNMLSGTGAWSSLGTLKLAFNVPSDDLGSHPDDLSVSVMVLHKTFILPLLMLYKKFLPNPEFITMIYSLRMSLRSVQNPKLLSGPYAACIMAWIPFSGQCSMTEAGWRLLCSDRGIKPANPCILGAWADRRFLQIFVLYFFCPKLKYQWPQTWDIFSRHANETSRSFYLWHFRLCFA